MNVPSLATRAAPKPKMFSRVIVILIAVVPAFFILTSDPRIPTATRTQAALLWLLCYAPAVLYLTRGRERRTPIPFLPVVGSLFGIYFALPIISPTGVLPAQQIMINPTTEYARPVLTALIGWSCLLLSYLATGSLFRPRRPHPTHGWHPDVIRKWGFLLLYGGLVADLVRREFQIPGALRSALVFSTTLGWLGCALLVVLAVQGKLSRRATLATVVGVLGAIAIQLTGGLASYVAIWAGVVLMSIWIGRGYLGRRWSIVLVVSVVSLLAIRSVMEEFRSVAWIGNDLAFSERVGLAVALIGVKVQSDGLRDSAVEGWTKSGRWGTIDVFAHVVRETPNRIPYWSGHTYVSLVGMAVPRVFWPTKPSKMLGQDFGHRYGILHTDDFRTSINLPYFIEFYANFGFFGVLAGMSLVGVIYRVLQRLVNVPGQSPLMSIVGLVLLFPLFNIESDFSMTFGGLLLNAVALFMVIKVVARQSQFAKYRQAQAILKKGNSGVALQPAPRFG